jgi:alkylation response protein AidB-like acyl-CoA dehydrogenase
MQFTPTPEQQLVRQTMREFAEQEVRPVAARMDEEDWWPS